MAAVFSTTMKERINFHALWCSIRDAWMANTGRNAQ